MNLIDSHCHLVSHLYDLSEHDALVSRAREAGVTHMIALGTEPGDWPLYLDLRRRHPQTLSLCLGIHPCDADRADDASFTLLEKHIQSGELCALGETGLDYYHPAPEGWTENNFKKRQQDSLERHFELAKCHGLNLVIHTRDKKGIASFDDSMTLVRQYAGSVRTVFHCFIGNKEQARQVLDNDGLLSFTGVATFKNAQNVLEVAQWCPEGQFMIETDSPYLSPEPLRGKRNEPSHLIHTARKIAEARKETLESLANHTTEAAKKFFSLKN